MSCSRPGPCNHGKQCSSILYTRFPCPDFTPNFIRSVFLCLSYALHFSGENYSVCVPAIVLATEHFEAIEKNGSLLLRREGSLFKGYNFLEKHM